jgi:hypothetical protein
MQMRKKTRSLVIAGRTYIWRFVPRYVRTEGPLNPWQCDDLFSAWLSGAKRGPLRIHFRTWDDPLAGGPLRTGAPLDPADKPGAGANLHTPGWAAKLVALALENGWRPDVETRAFVIEQGVAFLREAMDEMDQSAGPPCPPQIQWWERPIIDIMTERQYRLRSTAADPTGSGTADGDVVAPIH